MKNSINKLFLFLSILIGLSSIAQSQYPKLTEIVTDQAGIFSQEQLIQLRSKLKDYETKNSTQIVVLSIKSLNGDNIDNYANKVFNQNRLGQIKKDNGVLIVFSNADREVRIEVGYGLEHVLTDLLSHRIIYKTMIPQFKKKNYANGINLATTQLIEFLDDPSKADQFIKETEEGNQMPLLGKILMGLFVSVFIILFGGLGFIAVKKNTRYLINAYKGLLSGKVSLLRSLFLVPFATGIVIMSSFFIIAPIFGVYLFLSQFVKIDNPFFKQDIFSLLEKFSLTSPYVLVPAIFLLILIPILIAVYKLKVKNEKFTLSLTKTNKTYFDDHFTNGGSSGSSSSSSSSYSSSSSSNFSGGGGSSGGGGASGSW